MDKLFIGRKDALEAVRRDVFVCEPGQHGSSRSMMGAGDVGKTTLYRKWIKEFDETPHSYVYCVCFDFMIQNSLSWFYRYMFSRIFNVITSEVIDNAPVQDDYYKKMVEDARYFFCGDEWADKMDTGSYLQHEMVNLNNFFDAITRLGLHIIIIIDEFDRAREPFSNGDNSDGALFQQLFSWADKGGGCNEYNLTMLLVSRRRVGTIAHHMATGSDFEAAFSPAALHGFSDEDMEEYFESYRLLSNEVPNEENKKKIIFYCGRHPGLLMAFRQAVTFDSMTKVWNVEKAFENNRIRIEEIYNRLVKLMRGESIDLDKTENCIDTFIQAFIGPAYSENLDERLDRLEQFGFIYNIEGKNIFELAGVEEYGSYGVNKRNLEPLSAFFLEYINRTILPDELESLGKLLSQTEREVRRVILYVLRKKYGEEDAEKKINTLYCGYKDGYMKSADKMAREEFAEARGVTVNYLNVLAFGDYLTIIRSEWNEMRVFFGNDKDKLASTFFYLQNKRNVKAHENIEILSIQSRNELRESCEQVLKWIEKGYDNENWISDDVSLTIEENSSQHVRSYVEDPGGYIGKMVEIHKTKVTSRGSLRGKIMGTEYEVSIPPRVIKEKNVDAFSYVNQNVKVHIKNWDNNPNAQKYVGEIVL